MMVNIPKPNFGESLFHKTKDSAAFLKAWASTKNE
jgi:hypothetical protein